jgi:hypothetical protein
MARSFTVLCLAFAAACGSTGGAPVGDGDAGAPSSARDGGSHSSDGGSAPSAADGGSATRPDGGTATADGGSAELPDAGMAQDAGNVVTPYDGGTTVSCVGLDLSGHWTGTFDGNVWWTSQPGNLEPVSGNLEFTLSCEGQKYQVSGTMTGDESHQVTFTAQLSGEVEPGTQLFSANITGNVVFTTLAGVSVPFTGTMQGHVVSTTIPSGTWQGQSTQPLVPAEGSGTWQASRQ